VATAPRKLVEEARELGIPNPEQYSPAELRRAVELYKEIIYIRRDAEKLGIELPADVTRQTALRIVYHEVDKRLAPLAALTQAVTYKGRSYIVEKIIKKKYNSWYTLRPPEGGRATPVQSLDLLLELMRQ
jgi:hypothetical protein